MGVIMIPLLQEPRSVQWLVLIGQGSCVPSWLGTFQSC